MPHRRAHYRSTDDNGNGQRRWRARAYPCLSLLVRASMDLHRKRRVRCGVPATALATAVGIALDKRARVTASARQQHRGVAYERCGETLYRRFWTRHDRLRGLSRGWLAANGENNAIGGTRLRNAAWASLAFCMRGISWHRIERKAKSYETKGKWRATARVASASRPGGVGGERYRKQQKAHQRQLAI